MGKGSGVMSYAHGSQAIRRFVSLARTTGRSRRAWQAVAAGVTALGLVVVAVSVLVSTGGPAAAHEEDLYWDWGADPANGRCRIIGGMPKKPTDGQVIITATFAGCVDGQVIGANESDINVSGGKGDTHFLRSKLCLSAPCTIKGKVKYTGPGKYCALIYFSDNGYMMKHGTMPNIRWCQRVDHTPTPTPSPTPTESPTETPTTTPPPPDPKDETELAYEGETRAAYHDRFTASAKLTSNGDAVAGEPVSFALGSGKGQTCSGTTDEAGNAQCVIRVTQRPGDSTVTARFAGSDTLLGSRTATPFTVDRLQTALTYDGPTKVANGRSTRLAATLRENDTHGAPISGRHVVLQLGSQKSSQQCTGTTNSYGFADCTIESVDQPLNDDATVPVSARFVGDDFYRPSNDSTTVLLEYYTGRGYGIMANLELPSLAKVRLNKEPDTGSVRTADASETRPRCTAELSTGLTDVGALCPKVTTRLAPGRSTSVTTVANTRIGIPKLPVIELNGTTARSTSTCADDGSASGRTDLEVTVAGEQVELDGEIDAVVQIPGGELIINEHLPVPGADHGLTVNALHLKTSDGLVDIVIGSATSDVHNCLTTSPD